jgi:WD40 repeat protein
MYLGFMKSTKILRLCLVLLIFCSLAGWSISQDDDGPQEEVPFIWGGLAWRPNGEILAVGTNQGISLHSADDLSIVERFAEECSPHSIDWSPDGDRIVGDCHGNVYIWNVETEQQVYQLHSGRPRDVISSLEWNPNTNLIAGVSWEDNTYIWEADTGQLIQTIDLRAGLNIGYFLSVVWNPDGTLIAGHAQGRNFIWEAETGEPFLSWPYNHSTGVLVWSPDGETIVTAEIDNFNRQILFWDAATGEVKERFEIEPDRLVALAWSPDSTKIAYHRTGINPNTGYSDVRIGSVVIRDVPTGKIAAEFPDIVMTDSNHTNALAWSPDGSRLASISDDGRILIWNTETYEEIAVYDDYQSIVLSDDE